MDVDYWSLYQELVKTAKQKNRAGLEGVLPAKTCAHFGGRRSICAGSAKA